MTARLETTIAELDHLIEKYGGVTYNGVLFWGVVTLYYEDGERKVKYDIQQSNVTEGRRKNPARKGRGDGL